MPAPITALAAPPITVGELNDVPAPQSPINAQFHQEVANRITHRFATVVQMNAWPAANGSTAYCTETTLFYGRNGGTWQPLAGRVTGSMRTLGTFTLPNNVFTALAWTTTNEDTDGFVSSATQLTIPTGKAGIYAISSLVLCVSSFAASVAYLSILAGSFRFDFPPVNNSATFTGSCAVPLIEAETVAVNAWNSSGSAISVTIARLFCYRVSP